MPTIRHRVTREVIVNSWDLTGIDLSEANLDTVNLAGCSRAPADPPVPGYRLGSDRTLQRPCPGCPDGTDARDCGYCNECCGHSECSDCGRHDVATCSDHGYCERCCSCEEDSDDDDGMHSVREGAPWVPVRQPAAALLLQQVPLVDVKAAHRPAFDCRRTIGVEWEFNNGVNLNAWTRKWRGGVHADGSCGWEAVTPPLAGDYIRSCLADLGQVFADEGARANEKCGIHVHVDARDLKWTDMYRLLYVYSRVEPLLYAIAGQQRVSSTYAAPCGALYARALDSSKSFDRKGAVLSVALNSDNTPAAGRERAKGATKKDHGRYKGLNICPWIAGRKKKAPDTTVEFRLHRNTLDAERVIHWAQLCARIVDWAANATDKDAENLPKSALRALCMMAPDQATWILSRVRAWRKVTTAIGPNAYPTPEQAWKRHHPGEDGPRVAPRRIHIDKDKFYLRNDRAA